MKGWKACITVISQFDLIAKEDPQVAEAMEAELSRQRRNIELIASENIVSPLLWRLWAAFLQTSTLRATPARDITAAAGALMSWKISQLTEPRSFSAQNTPMFSPIPAPRQIWRYISLCFSRATVLGMSLAHGGHLTHGSPVNISGKYFNFHSYGVNDDGFIDYDALEKTAKEIRPKLIVAGVGISENYRF